MDICLFSDIKPTWNILEFDEKISEIPCVSKGYDKKNPLDKRVVIRFELEMGKGYVYYLPETNTTQISARCLYSKYELSDFLGSKVEDEIQVEGCWSFVSPFVYEMVLGESFVIRRFEITISCHKVGNSDYKCSISPIIEVCRYVFDNIGIRIESRDKTMTFITVKEILSADVYDTLQDADETLNFTLVQSFLHNAKILHKEEILRALWFVKKDHCKLGLKVFLEIYAKATEKKTIDENVPKRIIRELNNRGHIPNTAVRIEKDLVVVTGELECKYLDVSEQTRVYFDSERGYYFRKNIVTGKWQPDDLYTHLLHNRLICKRVIDKDIFDNTCMEKYAEYSMEKSFPVERKINFGSLLAQYYFLSAEQAAKTDSSIYQMILENIYEGKIRDYNKSLSELFGITGAQIKFLKDVPMPSNLESFGKCMESEDFKEYFPDVKKRIFAVAFYLNGNRYWNGTMELTREDVFAAAQTLNSLEKRDMEGKEHLLSEYRDYLKMIRIYQDYVKHMQVDDLLRQEILDFGEVPVNIKPSKIREYHNKLGRIVDIMKCAEQVTKYTMAILERKEKEARKFEYTDGKYSILMPKDAREIIREGRELQHCVGSAGYIKAMAANFCTILFLRNNQDLDSPFITIEEHDGSIRQCYGFRNSYNKNAEIRDFIKGYAALHNFKIDAVIFSGE